jgi:hypothetical protein
MLLHLLYKALFELSENRATFLAYLFGRSVPEGIENSLDWDVERVMAVIDEAPRLGEKSDAFQDVIIDKVRQSGVRLSDEDFQRIRRFHREFIDKGPDLRFTSHGRSPQSYYPTYRRLALETDRDRKQVSFLTEEPHFQYLKTLQESNKIIPIVGDFTDLHAIPEIGAFLQENDDKVIAFYTSNVEYYLMYQHQFPQFVLNVQKLPLAKNSVIIRSYFNRFRMGHPQSVQGYGSTQLLQFMNSFVADPNASYNDIVYEQAIMH